MAIIRMSELDLAGKRVLIRQDLNVPIEDGRITSEQRITASLPTLRLALDKGATSGVKRIRWRRWPRACRSCSVAMCRWFVIGWTVSRSPQVPSCCWKIAA